jgi:hypothetical protein
MWVRNEIIRPCELAVLEGLIRDLTSGRRAVALTDCAVGISL